jgi:hypothetical protein
VLRHVMAEVVRDLPEAIQTVEETIDSSVPGAMIEAITSAAKRRAAEIEMFLGS